MGNPRRSNGARRDAALRWLRSRGDPCWMCGLPIDQGPPARHPYSLECDELVPVSKGGSPYARGNLAASHRACNGWRSAKPVGKVEQIRAAAVSYGASWSTPEEFVMAMKAVEKGLKTVWEGVSPIVHTTTDW